MSDVNQALAILQETELLLHKDVFLKGFIRELSETLQDVITMT
jgi:hypothetical protein